MSGRIGSVTYYARSPQVGADPEATLRRVLNEEIAQWRIVYHLASRRFELKATLGPRSPEPQSPVFTGLLLSSPGWTRTNNPPVNSRMLCQLSYRGTAEEF